MKVRIISLAALFLILASKINASNDPVIVIVTEGKKKEVAVMLTEIDGPVQLFSLSNQIEEIVHINGLVSRKVVMGMNKEYYIGQNRQVELITEKNFKSILKKYLVSSPEIHDRLGKRGFRFENLPFMILFHNKRVTKGVPLTRNDVKNWSTI